MTTHINWQHQDESGEFSVSNPPRDAQPLQQYYEWRTAPQVGWWCKECWKYMDRMHSNTDNHKKRIAWAKEVEAAQRMGYGPSGATGSSGSDQLQVLPPPHPFPRDPTVNPPAPPSSINRVQHEAFRADRMPVGDDRREAVSARRDSEVVSAATQMQSHLIENLYQLIDKQSDLIAQQLAATQKQSEKIKEQSELIKNQSELMQEQATQLVELTDKLSQIATDLADIKWNLWWW